MRTATAPTPVAEDRELPSWATGRSLDEVKRHIHREAVRLYKDGSNCWDGTNDFLSGLNLPDPDEEYPAPADESDQVKAFIATVYTVGMEVGRVHGKRDAVEGWLRQQGIVAPLPTTRRVTLTVEVPVDADVPGVVRGLGWTVH